MLFDLVYQGISGHSPTIPEYFRGCPKTTEDSKKLEKIFKEMSEKFSLYFSSLISHVKDTFL